MSHRFKNIDGSLSKQWENFEIFWKNRFDKKFSVEAVLFLIGIQEANLIKGEFSKEEKQDLIHVGVCSILCQEGFFVFDFWDKDGWPHYKKIKEFSTLSLEEQEVILQKNILLYFEKNINSADL